MPPFWPKKPLTNVSTTPADVVVSNPSASRQVAKYSATSTHGPAYCVPDAPALKFGVPSSV